MQPKTLHDMNVSTDVSDHIEARMETMEAQGKRTLARATMLRALNLVRSPDKPSVDIDWYLNFNDTYQHYAKACLHELIVHLEHDYDVQHRSAGMQDDNGLTHLTIMLVVLSEALQEMGTQDGR